MKWFLFILIFYALPALANSLDEQKLSNASKTCSIHYLTPKHRNLWSIEVDKSYCKDGFVQGFTTVTLKDALNRNTETLQGFFHQGYWLSDFIGQIDTFYRASPGKGVQDFIFKTGENEDLGLIYYLIARSTQLDEKHYSVFNICPDTPTLLVSHEPLDDFKKSLFQNSVLDQAQKRLLELCPKAQKLQILGINKQKPDTENVFFQADINLSDESITISYRPIIDKTNIPKPTELRREQSENLLTLQAQPQAEENSEKTSENTLVQLSPEKSFQSAVDLALISHILGKETTGEVVVYVDHMNKSQQAIVTKPSPLVLEYQTALSPGWYLIQGTFQQKEKLSTVQVSSAKLCQKEWCSDEN